MPLYEYLCDACGQRFEVIQKFSDPAPEACTRCGKGPVERQKSSPAIQFKGSGFYITDYARKGGSSEGDGSKGGGTKKESGSEAASSSSDSGGESKKTEKAEAAPAATPTTSAPTTTKT